MNDLKYKIALTFLPGIGDIWAKNLVGYCGSAEAVFTETKGKLMKIPGIGSVNAQAIIVKKEQALERAQEEIEFINKYNIQALFFADKNYPERLKHCADNPTLLYYKGNSDLNKSKIISIVGTRSATEYGKDFCKTLIKELSDQNVLIVSGLAYGIDICAHRSSLENNLETVGVLAHGLDRIYPALHKATAEKMVKQGGLLTEFPSNTNPDRENFPKRNRIVAGMSDAVIVIETAKKGGAVITAEIANSYNRDVFALPGNIDQKYSEGCNFLIKTHKANVIESAKDIAYVLGWEQAKTKPQKQKRIFVDLKKEEKAIIDVLNGNEKVGIDSIAVQSKLPMSQTASILLSLEMVGMVKAFPGKVYELN
ncbi:MAG: DNA-protecting protein DprA [Bacteroidetes bacterium]|nr:MAG: DNA-protecting protein DprA [Bacteroidota bacterium]